ncbi:MAG TPA: histidine kinase [Solirubrobacteraceae bacterium]
MLWARTSFAALRRIDRVRVDDLIALVLLAVSEVHVWFGPPVNAGLLPTLAGLLISLVVATRRRWPLAGMIVILAALAAKTVLGGPSGSQPMSVLPALLLLFYGIGAFAPARRSRWVLGLAVVVSGINTLATPGKTASELVASELLVVLVPYALGRMARARAARERADREQAERLDARRELTAATAALHERARIARELHDVIAHSVSVMVIQAGGARMVMASEPARAAASLRSVERAGREALAEMRRLLGVLDGDRDPRALAPQPGLSDIEELLDRARASGLPADLRVDGEPAAVPPALDLCAYRIVQEALTNAIRHASPARAQVCVRWGPSALELEISDDGHGQRAVNGASGGHGIAGMRERVALHGGSLRACAGADGGFTVHACLPLAQEPVR